MARITLIAESLKPLSPHSQSPWKLAQIFSQQGHEVTVVTSASEEAPLNLQIVIMRPFKRWSWKEAALLLPKLLASPPEILLLVQPSGASQRRFFHPLYFFLSALKHLPGTEIACYLHTPLENGASSSFVEFLRQADILICSDRSILWELNRKIPPGASAKRRVIPLEQDVSSSSDVLLTQAEQESLPLLEGSKYAVMAPLPLARIKDSTFFFDCLRAAGGDTLFVVIDGWRGMSKRESRTFQESLDSQGLHSRVYITGSGSDAFLQEAAKRAQMIFLAPFHLTHLEQDFFHHLALISLTPAIITRGQEQESLGLWSENEDCCILSSEQPESSFADIVNGKTATPNITAQQSAQARLRSSDESVNLWSRLFAEPDEQHVR